jgi:hypothetical protein
LIYTGMPGLNERWQIFHVSYPDGVVSRITNDLDSYGSVQLTHFNAEEILSIAFNADGRLFASRGHTTSKVLLINNFQARNLVPDSLIIARRVSSPRRAMPLPCEGGSRTNLPDGRRDLSPFVSWRRISIMVMHCESKSFRRARSLSPSALGQLRCRHLHVGDYVGIPALFVAGIDCGCGIAVGRAVDHGGIRVQGACIQQ